VSICIQHYIERDFLDLLRADLAASTRCVDLLSPFVSPNRSSDYYPVFMALSVRSIPVRPYVRPFAEQPETLRSTYVDTIRNLELRGIQVSCRPGMHEKIAAIDGQILWHGSLNILSHNDSRESMLRFEHPQLVREILQDVGISNALENTTAPPNGLEAPSEEATPVVICAICGGTMPLFESAPLCIRRTGSSGSGTFT
jgi:hypothetical protein